MRTAILAPYLFYTCMFTKLYYGQVVNIYGPSFSQECKKGIPNRLLLSQTNSQLNNLVYPRVGTCWIAYLIGFIAVQILKWLDPYGFDLLEIQKYVFVFYYVPAIQCGSWYVFGFYYVQQLSVASSYIMCQMILFSQIQKYIFVF